MVNHNQAEDTVVVIDIKLTGLHIHQWLDVLDTYSKI